MNCSSADAVGFCALSVSVAGHALAAHGARAGWILRLVSGPLWLTTAILAGRPAYIATAFVYLALDLYGVVRRIGS